VLRQRNCQFRVAGSNLGDYVSRRQPEGLDEALGVSGVVLRADYCCGERGPRDQWDGEKASVRHGCILVAW
jgi:hypothetical protein